MKIAIAQTIAHDDLEKNLRSFDQLTRKAKSLGAELICFPEMAYFSGKKKSWLPIAADFESILEKFCHLAKNTGIAIIPGSLRKPSDEPEKFYNYLPFIDESGKVITQYKKIFLYRATLPEKTYDETLYSQAGSEIVTVTWRGMTFGLSICFDLRFPELFRSLKKRGAQVILIPSAFTVPTGQAHWEVLIRARAIENQFFVLAPGLTGTSGDGTDKYGHSLAVGPWGEVKASLKSEEGLALIEVDSAEIDTAQTKVPAWECRREDILKIT